MSLTKRLPLLATLALLAGCTVPGGPVDEPEMPGTQDLHIHLLTDGQRLGGYTLMVKWDPALAVITRIRPEPGGVKFPGKAEHQDSSHYPMGSVRIWGITSDRDYDVPAEYSIVAVTFKPLKPGVVLKPQVIVQALYDAKKKPKPITGRLNVFPSQLLFGAQP